MLTLVNLLVVQIICRLLNDDMLKADKDNVTVLILLDLFAAFDTVDRDILLWRLENLFGIHDAPLKWF